MCGPRLPKGTAPRPRADSGGWISRGGGASSVAFEPSISGSLSGDLVVPGYEPDGIYWLPHPAAWNTRAGRRQRWHSTQRHKPIAASEELPEPRQVLEVPAEFELHQGLCLES